MLTETHAVEVMKEALESMLCQALHSEPCFRSCLQPVLNPLHLPLGCLIHANFLQQASQHGGQAWHQPAGHPWVRERIKHCCLSFSTTEHIPSAWASWLGQDLPLCNGASLVSRHMIQSPNLSSCYRPAEQRMPQAQLPAACPMTKHLFTASPPSLA